jgi:cysteine-rich repeat protein
VITVVKDAVPNNAQDFGFTGSMGSFSLDDDSDATLPNSRTMALVAGSKTITESVTSGWSLTGLSCSGDSNASTSLGSRTATIDLDDSEEVTCTFTNTTAPTTGTIIIVKDAVPNDAQDFTYTSTIPSNTSFTLDDDADGTYSNTKTISNVAAGTYTVTEAAVPGWTLTNLSCTGGGGNTSTASNVATIGLDAGETVTCTYTNTKHASLIIEKYAFGGNGVFPVVWSGNSSSSSSNISTSSNYGTITVNDLLPGSYSVTEGTMPGDEGEWQEESNTCDEGVTLTAGGTSTCTIVNVHRLQVSVGKQTTNGPGASFPFTIQFGSSSSSSFSRTTEEPGSPDYGSPFTYYPAVSHSSSVPAIQPVEIEMVELNLTGWNPVEVNCSMNEESFETDTTDDETGLHVTVEADSGDYLQCLFINRQSECGNGIVESDEQCDDGNTVSGDGCTGTPGEEEEFTACQYELGWSCNDNEPSVCTTNCGDGIIAGVEECDDNNNESGDGCDAYCHTESCGDGEVNNTHIEGETFVTEQCDDGNTNNEDGCSSTCQVETGFTCEGDGPYSCEAICGDGLVVGTEQCDDGDGEPQSGDGCSSTCQIETGYICDGEEPSTCELHLDFGDAPDNAEAPQYPTLLSHNGARHVIVEGFMLGSAIDGETDGNPNASATGDDTANTDDEDGVTFVGGALTQGTTTQVSVVTFLPESEDDGYLEGWIDFNADGDWNDEGEHIIVEAELESGTHTFTFAVPADAAVGTTYARFRWSSVGGSEESGLSPTGYALDGEVEDYAVTVVGPQGTPIDGGSSSSTSNNADPGGTHRGGDTNLLMGIANFLAQQLGGEQGLPPGGFGGSDNIPPEVLAYICSLQRALPDGVGAGLIQVLAAEIADILGIDAGLAAELLTDEAACESINAAYLPPVEHETPTRKLAFVVDENGYPVSSDPIWNACITGRISLDLIKQYGQKDESGRYITCGDMHTGGIWKHPDLNISFSWSRQTRQLSIPTGYFVRHQTQTASR